MASLEVELMETSLRSLRTSDFGANPMASLEVELMETCGLVAIAEK